MTPKRAARLVLVAACALPAPAFAATPQPDKADTAWMLVCTALVLLMSVPALALF
jgi:Amt family ammonium transporter